MSISLSQILRDAHVSSGRCSVSIGDDWLQGRSLFGGLQAALALHAMRSLAGQLPLRSLQSNFIAPISGEVRAHATLLRTGKNTCHVECRLEGAEGLATHCLAIFGKPLDSVVEIEPGVPPAHDGPGLLFPNIPGLTPNFLKHFRVELLNGVPPYAGQEITETTYQFDLLEDAACTESHVVAFADLAPPIGLSFLSVPRAGSSLSWMLNMLSVPNPSTSLRGWRLDSQLLAAGQGYTQQAATLWTPAGRPLAISRQCMLVFG